MIDLDEWERMEAQCTIGKWAITKGEDWDVYSGDSFLATDKQFYPTTFDRADTEAVCYFRNNAKAMADEVRRLRGIALDYAKRDHHEWCCGHHFEECEDYKRVMGIK